eukprot:jgi/Psemu1/198479/e_gw1.220.24.1
MLREHNQHHPVASDSNSHQYLSNLRQEFEDWVRHHSKSYHSVEEKEQRFHIWSQNHHRTSEKNKRHGLCTLTKQHVFGSNHFKDLAPEEFQAKFLTGYKGAFTDVLEEKQQALSPSVRKLRKDSGIQFGIIGTMEPKYDADAFPNAVDWRDSGAVTDVRTQGECGACWAVTAVETVESAYFLATGNLYTLSESEIIICDDSCEMCSGGWPQNAFEWVMDHGGLPPQSVLPYDAYTLIALTADGMENENYADYSNQGRYGNIRGYGYATDRCLCYTDGSGCECEDQDEDTAVRNIATYGPAVVCLEASTWQDYSGGIMTSEIGCGNEFLDMNHCVQVVGYAFTDGSNSNCDDADEDCGGNNNSGSGSDSKSNSGSGDSGDREGYWIVRNQWGSSWGMNGYAYVAMGENTCGILNDMTVAYA